MSSDPLARRPLGRRIAADLRQEILFGRLPPGTRLVQHELCDLYGTSRMPVRDALNQLEYEGLLESSTNRRPTVIQLSRRDLQDIFDIAGQLHARTARRVANRTPPELLESLRELHDKMGGALQTHDSVAMSELNWEFHRLINLAADSPQLVSAMRAFSVNAPAPFLLEAPEWMERAQQEHQAILNALENGRDEDVGELMNRHVREAGTRLIEELTERGLQLT